MLLSYCEVEHYEEFVAGYREMAAELELVHALDERRRQQHITQEELAVRMGKKRESLARLFSAEDSNPTLDTLLELLSVLHLTADIHLRHAEEGENSIRVVIENV